MATGQGIKKTLHLSFDDALVRIPEALSTEGFGVLTEIDVQRTLEQKLGVAFRRYTILGACSPPFAHQALQTDLEAGLMMPCNVLVYEGDDGAVTVVTVDPVKTAQATGNGRLVELAGTIKDKLERVLAKLP
jgi:uncharacterized protein (DUF302 family)